MKKAGGVLTPAMLLLCVAPAWGEQRAGIMLDEVVVTATKSAEKIKDAPASINVIYGEDIRNTGIRSPGQYLQSAPGIFLSDVDGKGTQFWGAMRGMPANNNRYYQVLVDGIPRNNVNDEFWWFTIPTEHIERIEIMRGPASALYGRNAMGGVVNIITSQGKPGRETTISGGYGSHNENKQAASLSGGDERWLYRFGASRHASEGFRASDDEFVQGNVFGRFTRQLAGNSSLTLSLDYTDMDRDYPGAIPLARYNAGERKGVYMPGMNARHQEPNLALIYESQLCAVKVSNRLYYQHVKEDWKNWFHIYDRDDTSNRLGNEIQFQFDHLMGTWKSQLVWGLQYEYLNYEGIRHYSQFAPNMNTPRTAAAGVQYMDAETTKQFISPYLQNMLHLIPDQLILTAGIRYDYVDYEYSNRLNPATSKETDMSALSPKVGLTWSPVAHASFFANMGTGFRTPTGQDISRNSDLNPEKATNYELGLRGMLWDQRLYYQVAAYQTDVTDMLAYVLLPDGRGYISNAGEVEIKGVEVEFNAYLTDTLSASLNYSWNSSEYVNFLDSWGDDFAGMTLPFQPEKKIGAGLRYEHPAGLSVSVNQRWFDEQWVSEHNVVKMPAYGLTDLMFSYQYKQVQFKLSLRNAFDEDYASYGEDWGGFNQVLTPGEPRTIFGELHLRF
jgi:iron complex outermembrane recepter protein